eukprot:GHVU01021498.1.p3 GENE.GHVU01021498.1~~GHVU01021498.1.p3  ORF type:complete len:141 (-),score=16.97 GHVU01021498.1:282-704(-)
MCMCVRIRSREESYEGRGRLGQSEGAERVSSAPGGRSGVADAHTHVLVLWSRRAAAAAAASQKGWRSWIQSGWMRPAAPTVIQSFITHHSSLITHPPHGRRTVREVCSETGGCEGGEMAKREREALERGGGCATRVLGGC